MSRLNVVNLDRALRLLLGLPMIGLAATGTIGARGFLGLIGVVTGIWGLCPLYTLFGVSTTSR